MKNPKYVRSVITALSMALVSGSAFAYGGGSGSHNDKMGKGGCDHKSARAEHGQKARGGMMQLPPAVIEQLNLTDAQKVAFFNVTTASKAMRDSIRASMHEARQQRKAANESGTFDPREMFKQQDERMAKMQQARRAIQQQWLGFWDSLSDAQKVVVQDYMKTRARDHEHKRS